MEDTVADDDYVHEVFRVNPLEKFSLLDKYVQITTQAGHSKGFLDSADPVSQSLILSVPIGDTFNFQLFPGSSVLNIVEHAPPPDLKSQRMSKVTTVLTSEQLEDKRMNIVSWLRKNLLPVSLKGDVIEVHNGQLLINPPYEHSDCITDNSMVLARMHHFLNNLPKRELS